MSDPELIVISGMVGLGKSSLTSALARHYNCRSFLEPVGKENPWLSRTYASPEERRTNWLPCQLSFVMRQLDDQASLKATGGRGITDQMLEITPEVYWQHVKANGSVDLTNVDLAERIYSRLLENREMIAPTLVVHLTAPDSIALSRIHERGRENEDRAAPAWWTDFSLRHAAFHATYTGAPTLTLDVRDYDIANPSSVRAVAEKINDAIARTDSATQPAVGLSASLTR